MVQEVTEISWGKRIINALWGVLFGIALIIGGIWLVFWNEGHGLKTAQSLEEAEHVLIAVPNKPIDSNNDMRVVYFSGLATTDDVLHDDLFGISEKAIQLDRHVEMYQWEEDKETKTESQTGGSQQEVTTYTYKQTWAPELINSAEFKEQSGHQNPTEMPVQSSTHYANKVTVGDFNLPPGLIQEISGNTNVDLSKLDMEAIKTTLGKPIQHQAGGLYIGDSSATPKIGDMKVTITMVLPQTVSVIAQQAGETLQPYMAKAGQTVLLLEMGQISAQEMIHNAIVANQMMTWALRLASLVMLIVGFGLIMNPIVILADFLPFLGRIVGFGTGFIAFFCGIGVWSISVAIAWFAVRPLLSLSILAIAGVICYLLYNRKKKQQLLKKD